MGGAKPQNAHKGAGTRREEMRACVKAESREPSIKHMEDTDAAAAPLQDQQVMANAARMNEKWGGTFKNGVAR